VATIFVGGGGYVRLGGSINSSDAVRLCRRCKLYFGTLPGQRTCCSMTWRMSLSLVAMTSRPIGKPISFAISPGQQGTKETLVTVIDRTERLINHPHPPPRILSSLSPLPPPSTVHQHHPLPLEMPTCGDVSGGACGHGEGHGGELAAVGPGGSRTRQLQVRPHVVENLHSDTVKA
jgi:hypothetical protein